jgi:uncharacterized membrane protein
MDDGLAVCQKGGPPDPGCLTKGALMERNVSSHGRQIAWIASGLFAVCLALAALAAIPGFAVLGGLFSSVCHQAPGRCFSLDGHPFGLCVRCVGIYAGLMAGHLVFSRFGVAGKTAQRTLVTSLILMGADVTLEVLGVYHDCRPLRLVTGGLFGFACSWYTLRGLVELFETKNGAKLT